MALTVSRRGFVLGVGGALTLPACRRGLPREAVPAESGPTGGPRPAPPETPRVASAGPLPSAAPARACGATEDNIEGPYYRAGSPFRANLLDPGITGVALTLTGRVLSLDCKSPLANALLDIWHADAAGRYDNDGSFGKDASLRLRGKLTTDEGGRFTLHTLVPGRYLNGKQYRPAHVHAKVSAPGHQALTTQLYFPDDPYNGIDPFIKRSLVMDVSGADAGRMAHFDFVLVPS